MDLARRYSYWENSVHPELLQRLYLAEWQGAQLRLAEFNPASQTFEPSTCAAAVISVCHQIEAAHQQPGEVPELIAGDDVFLVAPVMARPTARFKPNAAAPKFPPRPRQSSYVVLQLNLGYVKQIFIPALVSRYFSAEDARDYRLLIVNRNEPEHVIFSAGSTAGWGRPSRSDVTADLMQLPFRRTVVRLLPDGLRRQEFPQFVRGGPPAPQPAAWQLIVSHKFGSLDQVVREARIRNLAVGFGILVLLAANFLMMLFLTRRARLLAHSQMEFVTGVTHELRTPLSVICSAGENLEDGVVHSAAQVRQYGAVIRQEGQRLSRMVEQVLEFAGLKSRKLELTLSPVDISQIVAEAASNTQALASRARVAIEQRVSDDLPVVLADEASLCRALENLVINAIKYAGSAHWVGMIAASGFDDSGNQELQISVQDRGPGISEADLRRIFEPFYRGNHTSTIPSLQGAGLGLALAKQIAEAHGGRLTVTSTVGQGSTFVVHLPVVPAQITSPEHEQTHPVS
jgi:signal transduction histidine kinase